MQLLLSSAPLRSNPDSLLEAVHTCPRDRLSRLFNRALDADIDNVGVLLSALRASSDPQRKEDIFRALRVACANHPNVFTEYLGERESEHGFRERLSILAVPQGRRQGGGLLTDFHTVSQLCLRSLGNVRALPLPARFPTRRSPALSGVQEYPGPVEEIFKPEDFERVEFGRSRRFTPVGKKMLGDASRVPVLKAGQGDPLEALAQLRYEAAVMDYFRRFRNYFGLESDLPSPSRGPANRISAWQFGNHKHLLYSAPSAYFNYIDELGDPAGIAEAGARVVRDSMRLARFGIFHTEPAPIFHSVAQKRAFLWNVGGLLPGAGDLEYWQDSFSFSNYRQSGIADFEHFAHWSIMPATVPIVIDTSHGSGLGFQYHLGNPLFCGIHVMALGYHRLGTNFAEHPETFRRIMLDAFRAFTGADWTSYSQDVDEAAVVRELSALGKGLHVGEYSGAYPHQEFIKALYAFTLRAIPQFVRSRGELRAALPAPVPQEGPRPDMPVSVPDFVRDLEQSLREMEQSTFVHALVEAGLPPELRSPLVRELRMRDVARVSVNGDSASRAIAFRAKSVVSALRELMPRDEARLISTRFVVQDTRHPGSVISLLELAKIPDSWCA